MNKKSVLKLNGNIKRLKRTWQLLLFILPAVVVVAVFNYIPMYGVIMAFENYNPTKGFLGSPWVGLDHFKRFFNSYNSSLTIKNTVMLSVETLLWSFPAPILLALLLNQIKNAKFKKLVQTATYMPYFISTVVLVSIVNLFLSPQRGFFGALMGVLGVAEPPNPVTDSSLFRTVYVGSGIWQTMGYQSIIYLAALSGVDPNLHEAAKMDGASKLKRIIHIDLPTILPTISIMFIMSCGSLMNVGFEKVYLMQNKLNMDVSEVLQTYVYKIGLINAQYGFSAAINLFNTLVNILLLIVMNAIVKKLTDTSLI